MQIFFSKVVEASRVDHYMIFAIFAVFFLEKLRSCGFTLGGSGLIGMGGLAAILPC